MKWFPVGGCAGMAQIIMKTAGNIKGPARSHKEGLPMASDHMIRASDQDRDVVVTTLRDAYTAGRLTLEEFDERTTAAYASRTWGELRKLTEDLPAQPVLGSDVPGRPL